MTGWDIDPAGVRGVVVRTKAVADDFSGQLTSIQTATKSAATAGASPIVSSALSGFIEHVSPDVTFVVRRCGQAMTAAVKATNAYVHGDLEMAATAQRAATTTTPPVTGLHLDQTRADQMSERRHGF